MRNKLYFLNELPKPVREQTPEECCRCEPSFRQIDNIFILRGEILDTVLATNWIGPLIVSLWAKCQGGVKVLFAFSVALGYSRGRREYRLRCQANSMVYAYVHPGVHDRLDRPSHYPNSVGSHSHEWANRLNQQCLNWDSLGPPAYTQLMRNITSPSKSKKFGILNMWFFSNYKIYKNIQE